MKVDGDTVIAVTGASRGIGRAIAQAAGGRGARVAILARSGGDLESLADELRGGGAADVFSLAGDVGEAKTAKAWMEGILERWGRIDALVNNAALRGKLPVEEITDETWDAVIRTNLTGPFRLMRAAVAPMRRQGGGHIVNVSSIAGEVAFVTGGVYCASKFGLQGLSECLMQEVRRDGIKVTIVCPGSVDTHFEEGQGATEWKIHPGEIARTVLYAIEAPDNTMASKIHVRPTLQGKP